MARYRSLVLLLIALGLPLSASAQINPLRGSKGTPLKAEDLTALNEATNRLLDRPRLAVGDKESWSSANTGVAGTVTAGNPVQKNGFACRIADYVISGPGSEPERRVSLTWCKTKDGWKTG
jgi:surface antigen